MINWTDQLNAKFKTIVFISFTLIVLAPLVYVYVAYQLQNSNLKPVGMDSYLLYIFLAVSLSMFAFIPFYEKLLISKSGKDYTDNNPNNPNTPMTLFINLGIQKAAFIDSVFILGFVTFYLSGDINKMLIFYPIGAILTAIHFPRKSHYEKLVEHLNSQGYGL